MSYKKQLISFRPAKIATVSFIIFLACFIAFGAINLIGQKRPLLLTDKVYWDIIITIGMLAVLLILHELLHAGAAIAFGKLSKKDISFGINFKQGMLYCHMKRPVAVNAYRAILIIPVIVTGIIPLVISAFFANIFMVLLFSIMTSGGAGDFVMFFSLSGRKDCLVLDHEKAPAYYLCYEESAQPKDFAEVTAEQEEKLAAEMQKSPYATPDGAKNPLIKSLLILIFLALVVLGLFVTALFLKYRS